MTDCIGSVVVHCQVMGMMNGIWRNALCTAPGAAEQPVEVKGGPPPRVGHVDVGVGAVADERVRVLDHLRRRVGMKVERGDDRDVVADERAHPAQQLPLPVLVVLGHHRPVQAEVDRVEGTDRPQPVQD